MIKERGSIFFSLILSNVSLDLLFIAFHIHHDLCQQNGYIDGQLIISFK